MDEDLLEAIEADLSRWEHIANMAYRHYTSNYLERGPSDERTRMYLQRYRIGNLMATQISACRDAAREGVPCD